MAKTSTTNYECSACGHKALRYFGRCPKCQAFSTAVEVESTEVSGERSRAGLKSSTAVKPSLKARTIATLNKTPIKRTPTGISEFDRVLGGGFVDAEVVLFAGQPGAGKALAASTLIPTPFGFKPIKDLDLGEIIFDGNGKQTTIVAKYNPKVKRAFIVNFSNGEQINACEDHLWEIFDLKEARTKAGRNRISKPLIPKNPKVFQEALNNSISEKSVSLKKLTEILHEHCGVDLKTALQSVKTTAAAAKIKSIKKDEIFYPETLIQKIIDRIGQGKPDLSYKDSLTSKTISTHDLFEEGVFFSGRKRWFTNAASTKTQQITLPFDPYVFGLWLGDGSSEGSRLGGAIEDIVHYCEQSSELDIAKVRVVRDGKYGYLPIGESRGKFISFLREYDLFGNKHIPEIFLNAGTEQRKELLRGLMDTDGWASDRNNNSVGLGFSDETLIKDAHILVSSLGCPSKIKTKQPKKNGKPYGKQTFWFDFITDFNCFKLPRKLDRLTYFKPEQRIYISSIEEVKRIEEEYYCLMVESPLHTFLCGKSFVPTHNSTASLAVANSYALKGKKVLYSSGEESEQQIGLRAARLGVDSENILIINETNLEVLLGHIDEEKPDFIVVDSVQTLASSEIPGSIGSVQQSKEVAHTLTRLAKKNNITMLLISQVIKSGDFSGSEAIQHIVDCALMLESDNDSPLKFLRATKNRFGDTTEVGVFQHTERGLEEVTDPSGIFLENNEDQVVGASCSFMSEGVRQIPIEIQALVTRSTLPTPRKQFNGINYNRGQIVCAILDKFCSAKLYENDAFISTVSGVKVADPQADLSIAASLLSSSKDKAVPIGMVFIGELSLTGQVRGSFMIDNKLKEAERLGFTTAVIPASAKHSYKPRNGMRVVTIKNVKDLLRLL